MVSPDCEIGNHQGVRVHDRIAVAELVGELDLNGDAAPVFDGVLGHGAGVGGSAAGKNDDLGDVGQFLGGDAHFIKGQTAEGVRAAKEGVGHRGWLVVDFFFHEGRVAALFGAGCIPVNREFLALGRVAEEVRDAVVLRRDGDDLVLAELNGTTGEVDESRDVRAEEVLSVAKAQDQGGVAACGDNDAGVVCMHGQKGESSFKLAGGQFHGTGQVALAGATVDRTEQRSRNLGVGVGEEC